MYVCSTFPSVDELITFIEPTLIAKNWLAITSSALRNQAHKGDLTQKCLVNMLAAVGW
jgi:hypothetical protein